MSEKKDDMAIIPASSKGLPAHLKSASKDASMGRENITKDDLVTPRLLILQAIDANRLRATEANGGKVGKIVNTVTNSVHDEVYVLNVQQVRDFAVFRKRKLGGGLAGIFQSEQAAMEAAAELDGGIQAHEIVETAKHSLLILDPETKEVTPAQIFFKSTGLQTSKTWNSAIEALGSDTARFAGVWKLGTEEVQNSQGTYHKWTVEFAGWAPEALYKKGRDFYMQVSGMEEEAA